MDDGSSEVGHTSGGSVIAYETQGMTVDSAYSSARNFIIRMIDPFDSTAYSMTKYASALSLARKNFPFLS